MGPWGGIAAGLLGGLFGPSTPEPILPPQAGWAGKFLKRLAKRTLADANSVPNSLPGEQAALAQQKGLAGEEYRDSHANMLAALGTNMPGSENSPDALAHFEENRMGGLMNMDAASLMQALLRRQQMKGQAAGFAQQAGSMGAGAPLYQQPSPDFSSLFQAIGQQLGQRGGNAKAALVGSPAQSQDASGFPHPLGGVQATSVFDKSRQIGSEEWARMFGGSSGY